MTKWARFCRLSGKERWLLALAWLLLPLAALSARLFGLRRAHALWRRLPFVRATPAAAPGEPQTAQARALAGLVQTAARHSFYRANCFQQSLVLWWLLHRRGLAGELCLGLKKTGNQPEGHAWVEFAGHALNESEAARAEYQVFLSLGAQPR